MHPTGGATQTHFGHVQPAQEGHCTEGALPCQTTQVEGLVHCHR